MTHGHKTKFEIASEIFSSKKKWLRVMLFVFMILFFATLIFSIGFYTRSIIFDFSKDDIKKIETLEGNQ